MVRGDGMGGGLGRVALAAAVALGLGACVDTVTASKPALMASIDTPVGAGAAVPGGGSEDFIVNVGRRTFFREGSAELDSVAKDTLDKQADWLKRYPRWSVKIQGFADDPGAPAANTALSKRRADAVRSYLASQGVAASRITSKGYGRDRLVRDCPDLSCKAQNRRVITNLEGDRDV